MGIITLDGIELDDQFEWQDEFEWDAVGQEQERSVTGTLLVQETTKLHGRPVTLAANGGVWTPLSVVRQLEAKRDQIGLVMPLVLADGRSFHVIFSRIDGAPLEAKPIERLVNPPLDAPYDITIRLVTVAAPVV